MFYTMYLVSICHRRQWSEPHYEPVRGHKGWSCKVTVNNREYSTDVPYATPEAAQENAATKAYMICRNFSANDGMLPGQRPGQRLSNGAVQGLPAPIGSGRRAHRDSVASYDASSSDETSSGSNSPRAIGGFEQQQQQYYRHQAQASLHGSVTPALRGYPASSSPSYSVLPCYCVRDPNGHYATSACYQARDHHWA